MYPQLKINRKKLLNNILKVRELCNKNNIEITGITKVFLGEPEISKIFLAGGIKTLGDSRIENLKKIKNLHCEKWLIRLPMISEVKDVIEYAHVSLNSEIEIIEKLNEEASKKNLVHKIILMIDLGDLREGYINIDEIKGVTKKIANMSSVELYGIGANLTCFSYVLPTEEKMKELLLISNEINKITNKEIKVISGGNSSSIKLLLENSMPSEVNNLRLGEVITFGREVAEYKKIEGTYDDVFTLECEIIEVKEKPSLPWGILGKDSYGKTPIFEDKGNRVRAICAVGKQDIDVEGSVPLDEKINIVGASSDHLIIDVTDSDKKYKIGEIISLKLGYFSTLRAFTSSYVSKVYE